jgi:amino acid permease
MTNMTLELSQKAPQVETAATYTDNGSDDVFDSSRDDQLHMQRMGKKQELNRAFRQISLISFTAICMSTWEWVIMSNEQGLTDGGRAGLFWGYLWTFIGYGFLAASLAEMAAMAPTA